MLPVNRVCSTRIWSQVSPLLLAGLYSTLSHFLVSELYSTAVHCDTFTGVWASLQCSPLLWHICWCLGGGHCCTKGVGTISASSLPTAVYFTTLPFTTFCFFDQRSVCTVSRISSNFPLFQPFRSLNTATAAADQSKVRTFQWETLCNPFQHFSTLFNTLQHFCHLKSLTGKSLNVEPVLSFLWHTLLFVVTFNAELGVLDCIVSNLSYLWPACGACATTKPTNSTGDGGFEGDLGSSQTNWISSSEVFEEREKGKLKTALTRRHATSPHRIPKRHPFSNILWCFHGFWFLKARPLFRRHQPAAPG